MLRCLKPAGCGTDRSASGRIGTYSNWLDGRPYKPLGMGSSPVVPIPNHKRDGWDNSPLHSGSVDGSSGRFDSFPRLPQSSAISLGKTPTNRLVKCLVIGQRCGGIGRHNGL